MTDVDSLKEAIAQYELQLAQVQRTLSVTVQESDRDNLLSLKADIEELIDLTKESLHNLESPDAENKSGGENSNDDSDDPLAREYALFKAELEKVSDDSEPAREEENSAEASENANNIEEELKQLEGMKCRAPHGSTWGGTGYHNAMISSVHGNNDKEIKNIQDIQVRVLFLNPTHKEMLPCPYYLDGKCKFSEEDCRFSHGELVPFSSLQQYREPDFQSIKIGSRVLAKQRNKLWHRSVVLKVPDKEEDDYRVKFEVNGNVVEVGLQDLLPLDDADLEMSDSSEDSDSDSEEEELDKLTLDREMQLGNWEKHTRGIGSKLMAQMGYVAGTGLGKRADGRIEPVESTALPAGKSLDHCMELRESTSCGKSRRKRHKKLKQRRERQYQRTKQREDNNEFNAGGNGSGKKSCLKEETSRPLSGDSDCESDQQEFDREEAIHKSLLTLDRDMPLGNWEKHTRGIGSKLMAQMGYIVGTGLGKRADGRVEPVEATVLPAGKSLDHCMELRESAGGDKNFFSAARKMRKREKKLEQQRERQYQREKQREKNNVFNFINATLGDKPKQDGEASCSRRKSNLKEESNRDLNVAKFQIGENIMRLERVSSKLKESLSRHAKGSAFYNNIVMQYNEKQKELTSLRASEKSIAAEQNQRRSKAKLSIF